MVRLLRQILFTAFPDQLRRPAAHLNLILARMRKNLIKVIFESRFAIADVTGLFRPRILSCKHATIGIYNSRVVLTWKNYPVNDTTYT